MAMTVQQRRKRDILIVAVAVVLLLGAAVGRSVFQSLFEPLPPGYLTAAPAGDFAKLEWDLLLQGQMPFDGDLWVPEAIKTLHGKPVSVRGFLLPLHKPGASSEFFIAPKPRGCYYCNPPGVSEVVQVNIANGDKLQITGHPITAYGTFSVAQTTSDAVLYTINDAKLASLK
jgi:hypothetical protein